MVIIILPLIIENCIVHETCRMYGINVIGKKCSFMENVIIGYPGVKLLKEALEKGVRIEDYPFNGTRIGDGAVVRSNTTIYGDVVIGGDLRTGHNALIRESTNIGDGVLIGTNVVVDGSVTIGNNVSVQSNAYIPTNTVIEDSVFIGPCAVLTNDKYPVRVPYALKGPTLRKGSSIGANSTILPGVEIGEGAMVAAGALVTKDVPAWKLAIGAPARVVELPERLKTLNRT
jgi:acetyltransferase-like isoleucine patch superfamily enzyme